MKSISPAVLLVSSLLALGPRTLLAEDGVRFRMSTKTGERTSTDSVLVAGERMLIDVQDLEGERDADLVFAGDRDEMLIVDHENRTVTVIDREMIEQVTSQLSGAMKQIEAALANVPEEQRAMVEKMMKQQLGSMPQAQAEAPPERSVKKLGGAEYAGRDCQMYEMWTGDARTAEICTVPFDSIEGGDLLIGAFEHLGEFYEELFDAIASSPMIGGMQGMLEQGNPFAFEDLPGFPVMSRRYDGDRVMSESVLESVERESVDMADLDAPAEYERRSLGGM